MKTIILLLIFTGINAQVVIGPNSGSIASTKNLLKLEDGIKGAVFSNSNNYILFPKYNITTSPDDFYDDLPSLEGSIIYNKDDDQYYKYDGFSWNPARQLQGRFNFKVSRLAIANARTFPCITGAAFSACADLGFTNAFTFGATTPDNKNQLIVDNGYLNIKNASDGIRIAENGLYEVGASLGFQGIGLAAGLGLVEFRLGLQIDYGSGYVDVADKSNYSLLLIADLGADKTTSFTQTMSLPVNAKVRTIVNIKLYIASFGGGGLYSASTNSNYSYVTVRQIKKY